MKRANSKIASRFTALGLVAATLGGCAGSRPTQQFETAAIPRTTVQEAATPQAASVKPQSKVDESLPACSDGVALKFDTFPFSLSCQMR